MEEEEDEEELSPFLACRQGHEDKHTGVKQTNINTTEIAEYKYVALVLFNKKLTHSHTHTHTHTLSLLYNTFPSGLSFFFFPLFPLSPEP